MIPGASAFDPTLFLDATLTEPTVRRPPLPVENPDDSENGLYQGQVLKVQMRSWNSRDGSKSGLALDVTVAVSLPPAVQQMLKLSTDKVNFVDGAMLDLMPDGRSLDNSPGKNRRIRIWREAINKNKPGDSFAFRMLEGQFVKVKIVHELYEGETLDKIGNVFPL